MPELESVYSGPARGTRADHRQPHRGPPTDTSVVTLPQTDRRANVPGRGEADGFTRGLRLGTKKNERNKRMREDENKHANVSGQSASVSDRKETPGQICTESGPAAPTLDRNWPRSDPEAL